MKNVYSLCLLAVVTLAACKKSGDTPTTASFKVLNPIIEGTVREGTVLQFSNDSKNAVSYHWDFGDGIMSDAKIPEEISLNPCGIDHKVTLTITDKDGHVVSTTQSFIVECSGKHANSTQSTLSVH